MVTTFARREQEIARVEKRAAVASEREACAVMVEKITMQEMLMAGGEMTAGEKRTLKAFQSWIANKIRARN